MLWLGNVQYATWTVEQVNELDIYKILACSLQSKRLLGYLNNTYYITDVPWIIVQKVTFCNLSTLLYPSACLFNRIVANSKRTAQPLLLGFGFILNGPALLWRTSIIRDSKALNINSWEEIFVTIISPSGNICPWHLYFDLSWKTMQTTRKTRFSSSSLLLTYF